MATKTSVAGELYTDTYEFPPLGDERYQIRTLYVLAGSVDVTIMYDGGETVLTTVAAGEQLEIRHGVSRFKMTAAADTEYLYQ